MPGGPSLRWEWNGERLLVENDRCGVLPLFWSESSGQIAVSTSIDALLDAGISRRLDDGALAVFLRTGFFVGEDTPFEAIRALPPSARLVWSRGGASLESTWSTPAPTDASRHEIVDRFGETVARVVAAHAAASDRPAAVLLSGGHDSRHILFALNEAGMLPRECVTVEPYPPSGAEDVAIARHVAASIGVDHVLVPQRTDRVAAEHQKNALTDCCSDEHVQFLPLRDYFARRDDLVFDGLAGDVLSQSQRLDPDLHRLFAFARFDDAADLVLGDRASIEPALQGLLTRHAMTRFPRGAAVARVRAEAAKHAGAANPIASFYFFSRMRREIALAPYALLDVAAVSTPFLDEGIVDLLLSVPFEVARDRRLHTDTMQRRYRELAQIPFAGKQPGRDVPARVRREAAALMARLAAHRGSLVDRVAALARTARALATGRSAHLWFLPRVAHLIDVEERSLGITPPAPPRKAAATPTAAS